MKYLCLSILTILLVSCDSGRIYEDNIDFDQLVWRKEKVPEFAFEIEDAKVPYNILINVRNGFDYPFYNLYYQYELTDSIGRTLDKDMKELILFDAKTGEPFGSGLGDMFDHQEPVLENYHFPSSGQYTIAFTHFMRPDTLPLILSVGARVEKAEY
ncbi:MAG: gliding motility lipoprotein GldH [Bacteroidota bacterium]